ncbi:MAG: thermonuclease family protein [Candidatus Saccharimonadales bacterium]
MSRLFGATGRRKTTLITSLILTVLLLVAQHVGLLNTVTDSVEQNQPGLYTVTGFSDGDTISVDMNGKKEKVRFIGVDTPETHKPNAPVQCYGPAASAFTKNVIGAKKVRLEADPLSTNRDRYDRLLRYVYLPDGTLVNERLIRDGYGFYYPYFPFKKSGQFEIAQNKARAENKGVWGNCTPKQTDKGGWLSNDL